MSGPLQVLALFSVPRNIALDRVEPAGAGARRAWNDFFASWMRGNHVRAVASFAAATALTVALVV